MPAPKLMALSQGFGSQRLATANTRAAATVIAVAAKARANVCSDKLAKSSVDSKGSCPQLIPTHSRGNPKLARGGSRAQNWARPWRQPSRGQRLAGALSWPALHRRLRRRKPRSATTRPTTITMVTRAKPIAPSMSPSPCQRSRMPAERVGTPRS